MDALRRIVASPVVDQLQPADMVRNAQRFSVEGFQDGIRRQVSLALAGAPQAERASVAPSLA